jgi:hypothetical protein
MFRPSPLTVSFLLSVLIAPASSVAADDRPVPPVNPTSQEECSTYQRQQIDYAHIAAQKSKACSETNRAAKNEDIVLYQSSCGGKVLSAFRSCRELSDRAWCALAGMSEKTSACFEKASAAEQKRIANALAPNEKQKKAETEKVLQGPHAALESGSEAFRNSPQQEQERAGLLEQDLAAARRDVETQTALAVRRIDEANRAKQAADDTATELRKSLQEEQERASRLEAILAAARRDIETQTALAAKAAEEASQLKQTAEQSSAALKLSLQKEHERAEALAKDLSMAHAAIYAHEAQARKASDQAADSQQASENDAEALRKSLQQEQERGKRLEQDLEAARHELESQAAKASVEAARLKQAAEDSSAGSLRLLQVEHEKTARLERELASERKTAKALHAASGDITTGQAAQDRPPRADAIRPVAATQTAVAAARGNVKPDPENAGEVARLVARASVLLGQGDIGSARVVLERAAETGDAQASFALAETYDPVVLRRWGAYGTLGDAAKARDLYARAQVGGIKEAKERFDSPRR